MARDNRYDWFRNGTSDKRDKKESAKTVWKFTKIFLYFSLFFFSMWGCVQIMITRTNSKIGSGVELYAGTDEISPSVASIHIDTTTGKEAIYTEDDNVWINNKETPEEFDAIIAEFKNQGGADFTLDQALQGYNGVARLVVDGNEINGNRGIIGELSPAVYSSEFDSTVGTPTIEAAWANLQPMVWDNGQAVPEKVGDSQDDYPVLGTIDQNGQATSTWAWNTRIASELWKIPTVSGILSQTATQLDSEEKVQTYMDFLHFFVGDVLKVGFDSDAKVWKYSGDAFGGAEKYIPIATWGQAFEMGRGSGPFYGIFVYPISYVVNSMLDAFPMMDGWESFFTIAITVIVISLITFALGFKGTMQQTKMQELNAKKSVIDAKYEAYKGNKQMEMRKRQEVQDLYKKEGISPMGSIGTMFITMPFFLSMWRVTSSIQHLKGTIWLGLNFAATSWREVFAGHWEYLWIMVLAAGVQAYAQIHPRLLTKRRQDKMRVNVHQKAAMKKNNKTQNIMLVVFVFMALIFSAGLQVYWIIRGLWQIVQATLTHHIIIRQRKNKVRRAVN